MTSGRPGASTTWTGGQVCIALNVLIVDESGDREPDAFFTLAPAR